VKINLVLVQKVLLLIIGLSMNLMFFFILDFIFHNGFAALFNFALIYPLLGVPVLSGAIIALCRILIAVLLNKN
jgi:hypothetical protein